MKIDISNHHAASVLKGSVGVDAGVPDVRFEVSIALFTPDRRRLRHSTEWARMFQTIEITNNAFILGPA